MTVTVYSKPACVQCNATYKAMDKKGINYGVVDVTKDEDALELTRTLGYMQAPVIVIETDGVISEHWSGFNLEKISETAQALFSLEKN